MLVGNDELDGNGSLVRWKRYNIFSQTDVV